MNLHTNQQELYKRELLDQIQAKTAKDQQQKMDRLKREYEEEMRVRQEVAELNSRFKIDKGLDRVTK